MSHPVSFALLETRRCDILEITKPTLRGNAVKSPNPTLSAEIFYPVFIKYSRAFSTIDGVKDFYGWNEKKISIDSNKKYNHPKRREVWWCSVGVNVGTEIYGKGDDYTRPVLIINAEIGEGFIGIPLTSKLKNGKYSCIIRSNNKLGTALVSQIRNFDKRRLLKKIGHVTETDYTKVLDCLLNLYQI